MPDVPLFTYQDAVTHGLDYLGGAATGRDAKSYRRAADEALRDLVNLRQWSSYVRHGRLSTVASYSTGTISYDHTGSAYEREVTLTTGTWPEWAAFGVLKIAGVRYTVATRESSSIITLAADSNPGADVASSTTYLLYRDSYPCPADFGKMLSPLIDATNHREIGHVNARDALRNTRLYGTTGEPTGFSLVGSSDYFGTSSFEITPPPSSAKDYDYLYLRRPRPLRIEAVNDGTVTITANQQTVTGSGTAFTDALIGSVLRVSASTSVAPTGRYGSSPYDQERVIVDVTSATALTVDAAWETSRSGVKYVISDPVDVGDYLLNAYKRGIERALSHLRGKEDRTVSEQQYLAEVARAASAEPRNEAPRGVGGGYAMSWQEARLNYGTSS